MQKQSARLAVLFILVVGLIAAFAAPAGAATNQPRGSRSSIPAVCPAPPAGYEDFTDLPPLVMTGSLEGCWYTKILTTKDNGAPSGIYQERGEEVFVGSLNGGPAGTFATTYKFTKWDPDVSTGSEVHGRCEHPIVDGSGTGGRGCHRPGRLQDEVTTGEFLYRGHISLP